MFALKLDQNNIFYHFSQQAQQRRLNSSITQCNLSRIISCLNHRLPRLYTFFHMYNHSPNPMYFRRRTKNLPYIFTALLWEAPAIVASKGDMNIHDAHVNKGRYWLAALCLLAPRPLIGWGRQTTCADPSLAIRPVENYRFLPMKSHEPGKIMAKIPVPQLLKAQ